MTEVDMIEVGDDINLDIPGPTEDVNLDEEESENEEIDPEKPKTKEVDWESDENPYKKRFGGSTKEVNEVLLPKLKTLEGLTAQEKARAEKLQLENQELLDKLKDEKPETYDNVTLQRTLEKNSLELAELKEKAMLDDFFSDQPDAKPFRDALKAHARAFPTKSLADIWNESFKDIAESRKEKTDKVTTEKKQSQPDKGKGTKDPSSVKIGGYTEEEFNKLPVAKRKEILVSLER